MTLFHTIWIQYSVFSSLRPKLEYHFPSRIRHIVRYDTLSQRT